MRMHNIDAWENERLSNYQDVEEKDFADQFFETLEEFFEGELQFKVNSLGEKFAINNKLGKYIQLEVKWKLKAGFN